MFHIYNARCLRSSFVRERKEKFSYNRSIHSRPTLTRTAGNKHFLYFHMCVYVRKHLSRAYLRSRPGNIPLISIIRHLRFWSFVRSWLQNNVFSFASIREYANGFKQKTKIITRLSFSGFRKKSNFLSHVYTIPLVNVKFKYNIQPIV